MKRLSPLTILVVLLLVSNATMAAGNTPTPAKKTTAPQKEKAKRSAADRIGNQAATAAREATQREKKASATGKIVLAERLKQLAVIWTRVSQAQARAAAVEKEASRVEKETLKLEAQARRGKSLVEQTEIRRARALARLQELGLEPAPVSNTPVKKEKE